MATSMSLPSFLFPVLFAAISSFLVVTLVSVAAQVRLGRTLARCYPEVWQSLPHEPSLMSFGLPVRRFIYSSLGVSFRDPEVAALAARVRTYDRVALICWLLGFGSVVLGYTFAS